MVHRDGTVLALGTVGLLAAAGIFAGGRRAGSPKLGTSKSQAQVLSIIRPLARGSYQKALLDGSETWSGSSLRGKARNWSGRYAASRRELISRIQKALKPHGLIVSWVGGTARTGPKRMVILDGDAEIVRI